MIELAFMKWLEDLKTANVMPTSFRRSIPANHRKDGVAFEVISTSPQGRFISGLQEIQLTGIIVTFSCKEYSSLVKYSQKFRSLIRTTTKLGNMDILCIIPMGEGGDSKDEENDMEQRKFNIGIKWVEKYEV